MHKSPKPSRELTEEEIIGKELAKKYPYVRFLIAQSTLLRPERPRCEFVYPNGAACMIPKMWDRLDNLPMCEYCNHHAAIFNTFPFDHWTQSGKRLEKTLANTLKRVLPSGVIRKLVDVDWSKLRMGLIRHLRKLDRNPGQNYGRLPKIQE